MWAFHPSWNYSRHITMDTSSQGIDIRLMNRGVTSTKMDRSIGSQKTLMNNAMFTFGMGSRTCIGKNISLLEIYKLVPTVLRKFEVSDLPAKIMGEKKWYANLK